MSDLTGPTKLSADSHFYLFLCWFVFNNAGQHFLNVFFLLYRDLKASQLARDWPSHFRYINSQCTILVHNQARTEPLFVVVVR